jgi:SAM-dependent methyltransferase
VERFSRRSRSLFARGDGDLPLPKPVSGATLVAKLLVYGGFRQNALASSPRRLNARIKVHEASKTNRIRGDDFKRRYFSGRVIDIGCGRDVVVPHAVPFDRPQGDAQRILDKFEPESFDCVHSSHCLEHMENVPVALRNWWAIVKPAGYLVLVVPDADLYEQGIWPSTFNRDHKATFTLGDPKSWGSPSYNVEALVSDLPGSEIIDARVQDNGYDYSLMLSRPTILSAYLYRRWPRFRDRVFRKLQRYGLPVHRMYRIFDKIERALGKPVDQTRGPALAQIQVVARKRTSHLL